ncbi:hypothetical protein GWO43_00160 [candidate division KSB1 bacterium]|nr:hypothetical protein [candidate division KSB1 bacterium]NIR68482.1 hypothetical protein [candidate division KSB1 bacterium]NIS22496.1 hypothetical protein [candidate division KSB1 bacterium]NIT69340.1 hypothetical protein [candidate division KSB1 bacterium]NIU23001.1 hypothetical protein [candidate division KSB1 bacterium]
MVCKKQKTQDAQSHKDEWQPPVNEQMSDREGGAARKSEYRGKVGVMYPQTEEVPERIQIEKSHDVNEGRTSLWSRLRKRLQRLVSKLTSRDEE